MEKVILSKDLCHCTIHYYNGNSITLYSDTGNVKDLLIMMLSPLKAVKNGITWDRMARSLEETI